MKKDKRQLRIKALELLYETEFQQKKMASTSSLPAVQTALAVLSHKDKIDQILKSHSKNWKKERMALLDLNILRLAVYEILFTEKKESPKIFINEAIELAKIYGSKDSPKFINGILDSISKQELK